MKGKIGGIDAGCLVRLYLAMKMFKLNSSVKLVGRRQKYLDAILSKEIPQFENFDSKIYQRIGYIESNTILLFQKFPLQLLQFYCDETLISSSQLVNRVHVTLFSHLFIFAI